jgi:succinate dehydrogenase / fumarate reductase cytochrome b subunit
MRWTGIIVLLFIIYHLLDLTWGVGNSSWRSGEVYDNIITSFQRWPVAIFYIIANMALAFHIFHGFSSMFASLGWSNPRFSALRKNGAIGIAAIILIGNVSMPLLVVTGVYP